MARLPSGLVRQPLNTMDALSAGLTTIANGALEVLGFMASPLVIAFVLCTISIGWLAAIRIEELDRQGTKPTVQRH